MGSLLLQRDLLTGHEQRDGRAKRPAEPNETVHHIGGSPGRTRPTVRFTGSCLGLAFVLFVTAARADSRLSAVADQQLSAGLALMNQGDFRRATGNFQTAANLYRTVGQTKKQIDALRQWGAACTQLGHHKRALAALTNALFLADRLGDQPTLIATLSSLGVVQTLLRETNRAEASFSLALSLTSPDASDAATVGLRNNLGNLYAIRRQFDTALEQYRASARAALQLPNPLLAGQSLANASLASSALGDFKEAEALNEQALPEIRKLEASHDQASLFATIGQSYRMMVRKRPTGRERLLSEARRVFQLARASAEKIGDSAVLADSLGSLARLDELQGLAEQALLTTRQAIHHARQADAPDAIYRWEWQSARLLKGQGDAEPAMAAYRRAIETFQELRLDLARGFGNLAPEVVFDGAEESFEEGPGALFFELADLLLQKESSLKEPAAKQECLEEVLRTIESLRSAELEDYLHDACVRRSTRVESIASRSAVLYVIPFRDRLELLVGFPDGTKAFRLERFGSAVSKAELKRTTEQLRELLETRPTFYFKDTSEKLYRWLVDPISAALRAHRIDTLVIVPDGTLRTIPIAALYDGRQFLIEQFAVAVSPGLTLLDPKAVRWKQVSLLVGAQSEAAQGNPALPHVQTEVDQLRRIFPGKASKVLLNGDFVRHKLTNEVNAGRYAIVHLASHGQFDRSSQNSFVMIRDGQLSLDDLERLIRPKQYRGQPVELLTLSACQTAAGGEHAALGLAGVAVKSGARSTLATLWNVNDETTSQLIFEFYTQLRHDPTLSKAKALQAAQLKLLRKPFSSHPCLWSPYLIIGNWL